jgi:hypothetical protein
MRFSQPRKGSGQVPGPPPGQDSPNGPGEPIPQPTTPVLSDTRRNSAEAVTWPVRVAASWSWRLLIVAAAAYVLVRVSASVGLVIFAVIIALFLTAVLHPLEQQFRRLIPRPRSLPPLLALLTGVAVLGAIGYSGDYRRQPAEEPLRVFRGHVGLASRLVGVVRHDDEPVGFLDVLGAGEAHVAGLRANLSAVAGNAGEEVVPLLRAGVDADDDEDHETSAFVIVVGGAVRARRIRTASAESPPWRWSPVIEPDHLANPHPHEADICRRDHGRLLPGACQNGTPGVVKGSVR